MTQEENKTDTLVVTDEMCKKMFSSLPGGKITDEMIKKTWNIINTKSRNDMTEEQLQKFYAMAEPRSENAIRKAEERKRKREEMMKQVYKYPLRITDEQEIEMPVGARILCVQMQLDVPCLWAEVDTGECKQEPRKIYIHGTGHHYEGHSRYIGTFHKFDGALVFHVFE